MKAEIRFDPTKARPYRKRGVVHAYVVPHGATYFPDWAGKKGQRFVGAHRAIIDIDPDTGRPTGMHGCAALEFDNTYERVPGAEFMVYCKVATVLAYPTDAAGIVVTDTSAGVEARGRAAPGDWVVSNPGGTDVYVWPARNARLYELVE